MKIIKLVLGCFLTGIVFGLWLSTKSPSNYSGFFYNPTIAIRAQENKEFISPLVVPTLAVSAQPAKNIITYDDLWQKEKAVTEQLAGKVKKEVIAAEPEPSVLLPKNLTIAVFGDSMVQTMGGFSYLKNLLLADNRIKEVKIFNYGVGAQNIVDALPRLKQGYYDQEGVYQPPLTAIRPDIVIFETMAYNPLGEDSHTANMETYRQALKQAFSTINSHTSAQIYLLATIAPHSQNFGQNLNWSLARRQEQVGTITDYFNQAIGLAREEKWQTINCFDLSRQNGEGNPDYINSSDGIHPSEKGIKFISQTVFARLENDILSTL